MKSANIAEFKDHLGKYLAAVEQGEKVMLCRRNVPVAMLIPSSTGKVENKTRLGCGAGSVKIATDLTQPAFSPDDWSMLQGKL